LKELRELLRCNSLAASARGRIIRGLEPFVNTQFHIFFEDLMQCVESLQIAAIDP
jgi:hypothetical protein